MTKYEWMKVRKEPHVPLGVWFSYYRENDGILDDPIEFEKRFTEVINGDFTIVNGSTIIRLSANTARDRLFRYYDQMFNIW